LRAHPRFVNKTKNIVDTVDIGGTIPMATQFFGADIPALLPRPTDECPDKTPDNISAANPELHQEDGNIFRGFSFAMLFNLVLLLAIAAGWELWRIMR
jgi:hypothetical protein